MRSSSGGWVNISSRRPVALPPLIFMVVFSLVSGFNESLPDDE